MPDPPAEETTKLVVDARVEVIAVVEANGNHEAIEDVAKNEPAWIGSVVVAMYAPVVVETRKKPFEGAEGTEI